MNALRPLRPVPTRGFTLIELLVVIAIIAILAGISFPVYKSVMISAKRTKASVMANDLNTAVVNYYSEYSTYPTETTGSDYEISGGSSPGEWAQLATTLFGNKNPKTFAENTGATLNRRNIAFISFKPDQLDDAGAPVAPLVADDNSPHYFAIVMDSEYNNYVVPDNSGDGVGEGVAVWLPEADDVPGSTPQLGTFKKQN